MVATVIINEKNGAGETKTNKTSGTVRMKKVDNSTVDNADPIVVPKTGVAYSMEKVLQLEITAPPATQIENIVAYTDGDSGFGTGVSCMYKTVGTYAQPSIPANDTGLTDLFTKTEATPIDMDGINAGPFTSNGDIGDLLVLSLKVETTAVQGPLTAETLTLSFDES